MKTFITLITLSLLSTIALAQHNYQIRLDSITREIYDSNTQTWDDSYCEKYTYNMHGLLAKVELGGFIPHINTMRIYYTYEGGMLKEEKKWDAVYYPADTTQIYQGRKVYTYDVNNNLTNLKVYRCDSTISEYLAHDYTYIYDQNGNQIKEFELYRANVYQSLDSLFKSFTTFQNGQKMSTVIYHLDANTQTWDTKRRFVYIYDGYGNLVQRDQYCFTYPAMAMEKVTEDRYTYNSNQQLIEYYRDDLSTSFDGKLGYVYDANGINTHVIRYRRLNAHQWVAGSTYEFTYDTNYQNHEVAIGSTFPYYDEEALPKPIVSPNPLLELRLTLPNSQNLFRRLYHYSGFPLNIPSGGLTQANIYPNPTSDFIYFDNLDKSQEYIVQFYDISGKLIISQTLNNSDRLSVNDLQPGVYVYTLQSENHVHSGKFIKK